MEGLGFIHEKLDIKILILYILNHLPAAVDAQTLSDLVFCDNGIGYFDYSDCLAELVDTAHITEEGGKYRIEIPAKEAYGASPPPGSPIPPNSNLVFEVEVIDVMPLEEAQQRFMQLQAQMGAQGGTAAPAPAEPR